MNVQCLSCSSRYSVPDAKVQGRKVRIKCKRCGEPILIDGTALGKAPVVPGTKPVQPSAASPVAEAQPTARDAFNHEAAFKRNVGSKKRTMIGMPTALGNPAAPGQIGAASPNRKSVERQSPSRQSGSLHGDVGGAVREPKAAIRPPQRTMLGGLHAPTASQQDPDLLWVVAVTEEDQRDLSTDQVVALYAAGAIDEGTYVWKDGMDDWCAPFEAPELRRALNAARIAPRRPLDSDDGEEEESEFGEHDESVVSSSPLSADRSSGSHPGMWHEPGRLGRDADPSFEDVTVSMNERQTEGLLEKARRADLEEEAQGTAAFPHGAPFLGPRASGMGSGYSPARQSFEFDDEEVTLAISTTQARAPLNMAPPEQQAPAFELSQRKGSSTPAPLPGAKATLPLPQMFRDAQEHRAPAASPSSGREPLVRRQVGGNENSVAFSLEALTKKSAVPSRPPPPKQGINPFLDARRGDVTGPKSAPPKPPTKPPAQATSTAPLASASSTKPASYQPAFSYGQAPASYRPAPASEAMPQATPMRPAELAAAGGLGDDDFHVDFRGRKRARWPWGLVLLFSAAVAASYVAKQPLEPWAKLHELTQGRFPPWQELNPPAPPPPTEVREKKLPQAPAGGIDSLPEPREQEPAPPTSQVRKDAPVAAEERESHAKKRTAKRTPERSDPSEERPEVGSESQPTERESASDEAEQPTTEAEGDAGSEELPAFDRGAAAEALGAAAASVGSCKAADGPTGIGRAIVTFANSGRATNANVSGAYAGTSVGSCIARLFQQARVPAFSGPPVKVAKSFNID